MILPPLFPHRLSLFHVSPDVPATGDGPLEVIPPGKDDDLRLFYPNGEIVRGREALALMVTDADLNIWLAGNQFFAMADVVRAFQRSEPARVGVITMPPGKVLEATLKGGWQYGEQGYRFTPDVVGQVHIDSLQRLRMAGMATDYVCYMHNELALMVARGNPKGISGIDDLGRDDLAVTLPNPITEGIMKYYAKPVLETHDLWQKLSGGRQCQACRTRPNVYFTAVHHREIPAAIEAGDADVGIVWATEVSYALAQGTPVEAVRLAPADSQIDRIAYLATPLDNAPHRAAAMHYVTFLGSEPAQDAYAKHGFVKAGKDEVVTRPIGAGQAA